VGNTILAIGRPPTCDAALVEHPGLPILVDTEGRVDTSIMATATSSGDPHLAFAGGEDMAGMRTSVVGLQALYRIGEMLAHDYDIDHLLSGIMDMIFDVVDADRGFILLKDDKSSAMIPKAIRYREELLEQIRREQVAGGPAAAGIPAPHARSSSRCHTLTVPYQRSVHVRRSSSAMTIERWYPPVQPIATVRRVLPSCT
jgi:hypothetical protein